MRIQINKLQSRVHSLISVCSTTCPQLLSLDGRDRRQGREVCSQPCWSGRAGGQIGVPHLGRVEVIPSYPPPTPAGLRKLQNGPPSPSVSLLPHRDNSRAMRGGQSQGAAQPQPLPLDQLQIGADPPPSGFNS